MRIATTSLPNALDLFHEWMQRDIPMGELLPWQERVLEDVLGEILSHEENEQEFLITLILEFSRCKFL